MSYHPDEKIDKIFGQGPSTEVFWHDINDCWKLVLNCEQHLEILDECKRYNEWDDLYQNPRSSYIAPDMLKKVGSYTKSRSIAFPTHKTFPTLMKFFDTHKDKYGWDKPEIRKPDAGGKLIPHMHMWWPGCPSPYLYNMSINHPEGCLFGIKPGGRVPYNAGDVMKIRVWNEHCVWNNSKEVRYHAILGIGRQVPKNEG